MLSNRRRTTRLAFLAMALAMLVAATPALAKPNFGGEWKLNVSKSDFGPLPAPSSRTDKITHEDPSLKIVSSASTENGDYTVELKYTTDGKENTNEIRGNSLKSTSKWDGDTLLINTKGSFGGNDITIQDKWTLSEDGKTITVNRHLSSAMGEADQKYVMEKQ